VKQVESNPFQKFCVLSLTDEMKNGVEEAIPILAEPLLCLAKSTGFKSIRENVVVLTWNSTLSPNPLNSNPKPLWMDHGASQPTVELLLGLANVIYRFQKHSGERCSVLTWNSTLNPNPLNSNPKPPHMDRVAS
jgi:hypothetical protein